MKIPKKLGLTMSPNLGSPTYPFVESESCDITGYGFQDRALFAAAVNAYDREMAPGEPGEEYWTVDDVAYKWVRVTFIDPCVEDEWYAEVVKPKRWWRTWLHPRGVHPVTTIWGQR